MKKNLLLFLTALLCQQIFAQLPVDANGWTIIPEPSASSKVIYVSSSEGADINNGLSPEAPVASLLKAKGLARDGYPDHILFKRGDVWTPQFGLGNFKSGKSATEPMVLGYYGDAGGRPLFRLENSLFYAYSVTRSNLVFVGLEIYAYKHDPNSADYESEVGISAISWITANGENILIEDCKFNYMQMGSYTSASKDIPLKNFKFRRNIILHSWAGDSYIIHELRTRVQGMYISGVEGILIEENFFDHNGWDEQIPNAGSNMFNHNIYMSGYNPEPDKIWVKGNILARPSAHGLQLRSGGHCEDNLFVQCAINVNVGYNYGVDNFMLDYVKDQSVTTVKNNVMLETRLMDSLNTDYPRTSARWGINDILIPCIVGNNILANSSNLGGSAIGTYNDINEIGGLVNFANNIVYKWYTANNSDSRETTNPGWIDPDRSIAHYSQSLGKEADTKAFLIEASKRPLKTWWPEYSGLAVNEYIRKGFTIGTDNEPPSAPTMLAIGLVTGETVSLSWKWASDNERTIGYNIYVDGTKINTSLITTDSFIITQLTAATTYQIGVKAVDVGNNESPEAAEIEVTTIAPDIEAPSVPLNLTFQSRTANSIKVSWDASTDNRFLWGYNIYVDDTLVNDEPTNATSFLIENLLTATEYSIKIKAIDMAGNESGFSNEVTQRTLDSEKPTMPQNVSVGNITSTTIDLSWGASTDNYQLAGYNVYLNGVWFATTDTLTYTITGLVTNLTYLVSVAAVDTEGNESRKTIPLSVTNIPSFVANTWGSLVNVYPTIVTNIFYVESIIVVERISVFDMLGNEILRLENLNSGRLSINIEQLNTGIYIVKVTGLNGLINSFRIIKKS